MLRLSIDFVRRKHKKLAKPVTKKISLNWSQICDFRRKFVSLGEPLGTVDRDSQICDENHKHKKLPRQHLCPSSQHLSKAVCVGNRSSSTAVALPPSWPPPLPRSHCRAAAAYAAATLLPPSMPHSRQAAAAAAKLAAASEVLLPHFRCRRRLCFHRHCCHRFRHRCCWGEYKTGRCQTSCEG